MTTKAKSKVKLLSQQVRMLEVRYRYVMRQIVRLGPTRQLLMERSVIIRCMKRISIVLGSHHFRLPTDY